MKSFILSVFVATFGFTASCGEIGVCDVSRVVREYSLTKDVQMELSHKDENKQKLEKEKLSLEARENALKNAPKDAKYWVDVQNLRLDQVNLERSLGAFETDANGLKDKAWQLISEKIQVAVTKIATDNKMTIVQSLEKLPYFDKNIDITQKVIDLLNLEYKAATTPPSAQTSPLAPPTAPAAPAGTNAK